MKSLGVLSLAVLLAGCAGNVMVNMPTPGTAGEAGKPLLAEVRVKDLRQPGVAASTREAVLGVPMGNITFDPPETQLVRQTLEVELTKRLREKGAAERRLYSCDLVEFGVNTVTTPIYWDVVARIRLVLKRDGKEYPLFGTSTQRTFIWPGESIIRKVVEESLAQVAAGLEPAAKE